MRGTIVSDGGQPAPILSRQFHKHHKVHSPVPLPVPSHPTPTVLPPSKMPAFGPSPNNQDLLTMLFTACGVSFGLTYLMLRQCSTNQRDVVKMWRRTAKTKESKVLKERLARFDAKIQSGRTWVERRWKRVRGWRGCSGAGCALWRMTRPRMMRGGLWW